MKNVELFKRMFEKFFDPIENKEEMIHVKNALQSIFKELDLSSVDPQDGKELSELLLNTLIDDERSSEDITTKLTELKVALRRDFVC